LSDELDKIHGYRYWKVSLVVLGIIALSSGLARAPGFWSSYVLDMVGPPWGYILLRGVFSRVQPAMLSRRLNPERALLLIVGICGLIEAAQYFHLYEAHYDPYDFLAYVSLILPAYAIDRLTLNRRETGRESRATLQ
jgi:hypothetical protein